MYPESHRNPVTQHVLMHTGDGPDWEVAELGFEPGSLWLLNHFYHPTPSHPGSSLPFFFLQPAPGLPPPSSLGPRPNQKFRIPVCRARAGAGHGKKVVVVGGGQKIPSWVGRSSRPKQFWEEAGRTFLSATGGDKSQTHGGNDSSNSLKMS